MLWYIYIYEETLIKKKKRELPLCSKDLDNPTYGLFKKAGALQVNLPENELRFILFNMGRRGCMGVQLGTSMNVMLLARLLQGFSWSFQSNMEKIDLSKSINNLSMAKPLLPTQSHVCV
jgi:hypothetical protein